MEPRITIALVDDDAAFLFTMSQRLQARGFQVRGFRDGETLLAEIDRGVHFDCICADVRMPGVTGLDLQRSVADRAALTPVIMFTGYGDLDVAVTAIKAGARDFVGKPIDEERLIASIKAAVADARRRADELRAFEQVAARVAELSERRREVLDLMVKGLTSKQIASELNINHRTVENYRAAVMQHIGVGNIAQLVRLMVQLEMIRSPDRGFSGQQGSAGN